MSLRSELARWERPRLTEEWASGYSPRTLHGLLSMLFWGGTVSDLSGWNKKVNLVVGAVLGWHHFRLWRKIRAAEREEL